MKLSKIMEKIKEPEITLEIGKCGYDSNIYINGKQLTRVKSFSMTVSVDEPTKLIIESYNDKLKIIKGTFKMIE